jgi:glycosyltransferase involved in cell wall biosynthesis
MIKISVIICAYNPDPIIFNQVIESLKNQSLKAFFWELIIVDNNSTTPIFEWLDLSWHINSKIVVEKKQGLIYSRIRGTKEAKYDYLVSVDDDTPLFENYLENVQKIYTEFPDIGIIGGRSFPIFESPPPDYINRYQSFLAIRDLGEEKIIDQLTPGQSINTYPSCAPILIAPRKSCMLEYLDFFKTNSLSSQLGRSGESLSSGEDNDINLFIFKKGYAIGYFPELKFYHIIPSNRLTTKYLKKMAYESNRSWVKVLQLHQILPWKPISKFTYQLRCIKSYITNKAFASDENSIKWSIACGIFKGLSELK